MKQSKQWERRITLTPYICAAVGGLGLAFFPLFYKSGVKSIESNRSTVFALLFLLFAFLTLAFLSPLVALGIIVIRIALKRIAKLWGPEEVPKGLNAPLLADAISPATAALLSKIEEEVRREAQSKESSNPVPRDKP